MICWRRDPATLIGRRFHRILIICVTSSKGDHLSRVVSRLCNTWYRPAYITFFSTLTTLWQTSVTKFMSKYSLLSVQGDKEIKEAMLCRKRMFTSGINSSEQAEKVLKAKSVPDHYQFLPMNNTSRKSKSMWMSVVERVLETLAMLSVFRNHQRRLLFESYTSFA